MTSKVKPTLIVFLLVFAVAFLAPNLFLPATAVAASPSVITNNASSIDDETATISGEIIRDGGENIIEFGFYYGTDEDEVADADSNYTEADGDEDEFYIDLEDLYPGETYYFMAYAINADGISYGSVESFETDESVSSRGDLDVVTDTADDINEDEATLYSHVEGYDENDYEIIEYGFFHGSNEGDVEDVADILAEGDNDWDCDYDSGDDYTSEDEDEFEFWLQLSNLDQEDETYYYRAYIEYEDDDGDEYYSLGDTEDFDLEPEAVSGPPSVFTIGSPVYSLRGVNQTMDVAPYAKDNRTYLPIRYVAYAMGLTDADIMWIQSTGTVILTKGTNTVVLIIGSPVLYSNGLPVAMDVAPEVSNNRTCLPISWVASAFGSTATWDGVRTVTITSGTPPTFVKGDISLDDTSITLEPGDDITVTGTLDADGFDIQDVAWDVDGDDVVVVDIEINGDSFDATIEVDDSADDGDQCTITFAVTDEKGNDYEVELDVMVEEASNGDLTLDDYSITLEPGDNELVIGTLDVDGLDIDYVDWDVDGDDVVSVDIDINGDSFDATIEVDDNADDGDECTIIFTVTDEEGDDYEVELDVTVEDNSSGDGELYVSPDEVYMVEMDIDPVKVFLPDGYETSDLDYVYWDSDDYSVADIDYDADDWLDYDDYLLMDVVSEDVGRDQYCTITISLELDGDSFEIELPINVKNLD